MTKRKEVSTPDVRIESYQPPAIDVIEMEMEVAVLSGMSSSEIEDY